MARGSTFDLHDKALGGGLEARLKEAREAGKTYLDIAFELRGDGLDVSPSTLQRWCVELGIAA